MENISTKQLGEYIFKVLPFEVDFRSKLKLPHIVNYMLNSAGYHADYCNFGLEKMKERNASWVLLRVAIEMFEYPKIYEKIKVQTWCEGYIKSFAKRNYAFLNLDGKVLGYARSIWTTIDNTLRKPTDISDILTSDFISEKECPIPPLSKIPVVPDNNVPKFSFDVKYSDIDINQHLNSCKYVEHVMDAFTLHKFEHRDVKRFEIDFLKESVFGEQISLYKEEKAGNIFYIELRNQEGIRICKSKIKFGDKLISEKYNPGIHAKQ